MQGWREDNACGLGIADVHLSCAIAVSVENSQFAISIVRENRGQIGFERQEVRVIGRLGNKAVVSRINGARSRSQVVIPTALKAGRSSDQRVLQPDRRSIEIDIVTVNDAV